MQVYRMQQVKIPSRKLDPTQESQYLPRNWWTRSGYPLTNNWLVVAGAGVVAMLLECTKISHFPLTQVLFSLGSFDPPSRRNFEVKFTTFRFYVKAGWASYCTSGTRSSLTAPPIGSWRRPPITSHTSTASGRTLPRSRRSWRKV